LPGYGRLWKTIGWHLPEEGFHSVRIYTGGGRANATLLIQRSAEAALLIDLAELLFQLCDLCLCAFVKIFVGDPLGKSRRLAVLN
jgi:hypothetical protein